MPIKITLPEAAKTLVLNQSHGVLSTLSTDGGFPYGSVVDYLPLSAGDVVVILSELAEHFRYLKANPKASVLIAPQLVEEDSVPQPRVTLLGEAAPLPPSDSLRAAFVDRHPEAASYIEMEHLHMVQLDVQAVRYVAGMGRTGWLDPVQYREADVDPLGADSGWLCNSLNQAGTRTLHALASAFAGIEWASQFQVVAVDRYGFDLVCVHGPRRRAVRLPFSEPVADRDQFDRAIKHLIHRASGNRAAAQ